MSALLVAAMPLLHGCVVFDVFWEPMHYGQHNIVTEAAAVPITAYQENADAFSQFDAPNGLFIGRVWDNPPTGNRWSLTLSQFDSVAKTFNLTKRILIPPVTIQNGNYHLVKAVDPSVALYNGEYWVAFECRVTERPTASSCIGPLTAAYDVDLDRTYVAVFAKNDAPFIYSASVPKLFVHLGRVYLYWSRLKMRMDVSFPASVERIEAAGIELEQEPTGKRRLWAKGVGAEISTKSASAYEPWEVGSEPGSNKIVDVFDVKSDGEMVYATAALGGEGCFSPWVGTAGCYRLAISRSPQPLGNGVFNGDQLPEIDLPDNPVEYARFFVTAPDPRLSLMGYFVAAPPGTANVMTLKLGLLTFPVS